MSSGVVPPLGLPRAAEPDVIELLDSDDETPEAQQRQVTGSSRGAGPSSRPQQQQQQQQQQQPPQQQRRRQQAGPRRPAPVDADADVVDLTGPVPDLGDVQVVSVTRPPLSKRMRLAAQVAALSPKKQAAVEALLATQQRAAALPPPEPEPPGPKCGICLEAMGGSEGKQMASGPCGHVYCRDCLLAALKVQKKCPSCRKNLQPKQVHNVFLSMS